ncbi:glycosyltransferase [Nocardioides sp. R1-1]|uniref:glycosyltransferase n=1 Tax=Nocardioides sp. R1-1 TaxID=3383502 RepID=UPI0038D218F8
MTGRDEGAATALPAVACVVVHHRSPDTLVRTVASLVEAGVEPRNVVVVDNSEDDSLDAVAGALATVAVLTTPNDGYGAAVNAGVAWLARERPEPAAVLVATHEVLVQPDTLAELVRGLDDPAVAAVGPLLWDSEDQTRPLWSAGGLLAGRGLVARHHRRPVRPGSDFAPVDWLDGSLVLYRRALLEAFPFDPAYFLYLEEVDLHLRLRRAGWRVSVAQRARAVQTTHGMPAYWAMRNRVYFSRTHSLGVAGRLGTLRVLLQLVRRAVRARDPRLLRGTLRGLAAGARLRSR